MNPGNESPHYANHRARSPPSPVGARRRSRSLRSNVSRSPERQSHPSSSSYHQKSSRSIGGAPRHQSLYSSYSPPLPRHSRARYSRSRSPRPQPVHYHRSSRYSPPRSPPSHRHLQSGRYSPTHYNGRSTSGRGYKNDVITQNGRYVDSRIEELRLNPPENKVLAVFGLDRNCEEIDLMNVFKKYGARDCKLITDKRVCSNQPDFLY